MDSRERVFLTLEHQEPDRVPIDCWASSGTKRKIEAGLNISYQKFLDEHDVDLRYIEGPRYIGLPHTGQYGPFDTDIWGVPRKQVRLQFNDGTGQYEETYKEVLHSPLQQLRSVEEILAYDHWPSADWFDYRVIERQGNNIREAGRVVVFMGDRLNRLAQLSDRKFYNPA